MVSFIYALQQCILYPLLLDTAESFVNANVTGSVQLAVAATKSQATKMNSSLVQRQPMDGAEIQAKVNITFFFFCQHAVRDFF